MDINQIKNGQKVCLKDAGDYVATVDHLDGPDYIKLRKDDSPDGRHHWIPVSWVDSADENTIYVDKTPEQFNNGLFLERPAEAA